MLPCPVVVARAVRAGLILATMTSTLSPVSRVQHLVGTTLRAKVAGSDADSAAEQIWGTPGPRWFGPQDPIAWVHGDASMFPGGIAALLLQSLHPLAMAGVAGHSGYQSDPWGRLQRTSTYLATTTYGTIEAAEAIIDRVRGIHERVKGKDHRGVPYRADDPHLLAWVHVAEVSSFLRAHRAYGTRQLRPEQEDRYVAQAGVAAARLGVLDPPSTVSALQSCLASYRPELQASPAAREAARFLLLHPPLSPWARPGYAALATGALAVLPPWALRELGLPTAPRLARWLGRPVGLAASRGVGWALAGVDEHRNRFADQAKKFA